MNGNESATLWINATIATENTLLKPAAISISDGKIKWLGKMNDLPKSFLSAAANIHDLQGALITPGLIDCHTHVVYAGNRANEFELRLQGHDYAAIAKAGGGIFATVEATRKASEHELLTTSLARAESLMLSGVTTIEIKSGYGLDWETELKMLRVAQAIEKLLPLTIKKTFLGAHTVPKEYKDHGDKYVEFICHEMIPHVANEKLADSVDVFCETIAFTKAQTEEIFKVAKASGLDIKCHAEQLSDSNAAELAANYGALSADHLEYVSLASIKAMKKADTVAVLLPGAYYSLREKQTPPIDLLRKHAVPIAIASDCNPGTSPICSMPIIMNMAATLFRLTPQEIWQAVTLHAAKALNLQATLGSLRVGKIADLAIWQTENPVDIIYYMGQSFLHTLVKNGRIIDLAAYTNKRKF